MICPDATAPIPSRASTPRASNRNSASPGGTSFSSKRPESSVVALMDRPTTLTFAPPALASALTLSDIAEVPVPSPTVPPMVAPGGAAGLEAAAGVGLGAAGDPGAESQAAAAAASTAAIDSDR